MSNSIQVVLWVVLGVVVFLGLFRFLFFRVALWGMKWVLKTAERANTTQPRRVSLLPRDAVEWSQPEAVAGLVRTLEAAGFVDAGRFEVKEMNSIKLQGMVHLEQRMAAVIYDHASISMVDLGVDYEDGSSICYGNQKLGFSMARPDHMVQRTFPGLGAGELLARLQSECPVEGRKPIPADRFAFWFEDQYFEQARWMAERGGPTLEETAQMVKAGGHTASDETVREMYEASAEGYLKHWLHNQPDLTENDPAWNEVELGLTVVHDGLRLETVVERFNASVPTEMERKRSDLPAGITGAREAFAHLNQQAGQPYRIFREKRQGLATDFYVETDLNDGVSVDGERQAA